MCTRDQNAEFHTENKEKQERGLEEWRERVQMDIRRQVPGTEARPLRVQARGQGERQEEQGEGRWSQREEGCKSDPGPEGPLVRGGQVRWRRAMSLVQAHHMGGPGVVRQRGLRGWAVAPREMKVGQ